MRKKFSVILLFCMSIICFSACQKKENKTLSHGDWVVEEENVTIEDRVYAYIKYRIKPANEVVIDAIATDEENLVIPGKMQGYPVKAIGTLELEEAREPVILNDQKELNKIIVPEGVEIIGQSSFEKVHAREVILPKTLKEIGERAFWNSKITYVRLDSKDTVFRYDSFAESKLQKIDLPENFAGQFRAGCFQSTELETIYWPNYNKNYGMKLENNRQVEESVFQNCRELKQVIFPDEQQFIKIEYGTFNGCSKLRELTFPPNIKKVAYGSHPYADNNKAGGPDKLVFLGSKTEWDGIPCHYDEKLENKEVLTTGKIQAPKDSKAIKKAKRALRVSWLSQSAIEYENEEGVTENITGLGEGNVKLKPLQYEYIKK